jgi:hypothetical protein
VRGYACCAFQQLVKCYVTHGQLRIFYNPMKDLHAILIFLDGS